MEEYNKAPSFIGMAEDECEQHLSETYENINRFNRKIGQIVLDIKRIENYLQEGNKEKADEIITSGELSMALRGFNSFSSTVQDLEKSAACAAATHHVLFRAKQELFLKS